MEEFVRTVRWAVFLAVAAAFFALAISGEVYNATSPPDLPHHVLLRKAYSVVAFAIVGFTLVWALQPPRRALVPVAAFVLAVFSGFIEIGQEVTGSEEPLWSQVFDVACGAGGGAIGGALAAITPWVRAR